MRSEIVRELESEYLRRREENDRIADRRQAEAEGKIPGLREAMEERQALIFNGLRGILSQQSQEGLPGKMAEANRRIEAMLTGAGYPRNWLDPVYTCPKCRDTGYVGTEERVMCSCMRQELNCRIDRAIGLGEEGEQSFETWDENVIPDAPVGEWKISQRTLSRKLRDECRGWSQAWPDTPVRIVVLTGPSGLGKTFLMHSMAKALMRRDRDVLLLSAYAALEQARSAYFGRSAEAEDTLMSAEVLMLDDFGSEPMMNGVTVEQFYNLFAERARRGLATVVSTNLSPAELQKRYTERIASRLLDSRHSLVLEFRGQDIRRPTGLKTGGQP